MKKKELLLTHLADGRFHSGQVLANRHGISRTAVWKQLQSLQAYGIDIYSVPGKGYRLAYAIELLDKSEIIAALSNRANRLMNNIEILFEAASTNQILIDKLPGSIHGQIILAEFQSHGRGRRGSAWISPVGSGICLSLGWHFASQPDSINGLSLATGVAVARALGKLGAENIELKWPNDIICGGKKLGGILLESQGESAGPYDVVIGIGINVKLPKQVARLIEQPYTDLSELLETPPSRNIIAGTVISETLCMLDEFSVNGFSAFIDEWRTLDQISGKDANLILPNKVIRGRVLGIDQHGMLSMLVNGEEKVFSSGELSLRVSV